MIGKKIDDRAPARRLRPLLRRPGCYQPRGSRRPHRPDADPRGRPDRPMSLAELQLEAFTGKATIEMEFTPEDAHLPPPIKGGRPMPIKPVQIALGTVSFGIKKGAFDPITNTKNADVTTTAVQQAAVSGRSIGQALISIKPADSNLGPDTATWPLHLTLSGVNIASDGMTASTATPTTLPPDPETVTMVANQINFSYQDAPGIAVQQFQWNLSTKSPG